MIRPDPRRKYFLCVCVLGGGGGGGVFTVNLKKVEFRR